MIIYYRLALIIALFLLFSSCESAARKQCHNNMVGKYLYDTSRNRGCTPLEDSLKNTFIVFNADSTFYSNIIYREVLDEAVGRWNAGTCGFESAGSITFKNTRHVVQFSPCYEGDSEFAILGLSHGREVRLLSGRDSVLQDHHYYWYKKI